MLNRPENLTERGDPAALWAAGQELSLRRRRYTLHQFGTVRLGFVGVSAALRRLNTILGAR